jgi:hypothetical protein
MNGLAKGPNAKRFVCGHDAYDRKTGLPQNG